MKTINVVAAIIRDGDGRVFCTQRGYGEWKDWWEFPGGKIEPGETSQEALKREIREELDTEIEVGELLTMDSTGSPTTVEYDYPKFHLSMQCFLCSFKLRSEKLEVREKAHYTLLEHKDARWLSKDELDTVKWLPADRDIIVMLKNT